MTKPDAEPMTNIATDVIEGYKTGLAGGPMGFVSAAFDCGWLTGAHERAALSEQPSPIDMVLHCPVCGVQHIDAPEFNGTREDKFPAFGEDPAMSWTNPPHRSHLCHGCGHIWRPADVPTNGVDAIKTKGKADAPLGGCAAPTPPAKPVETVPWPTVTRYSGGASHEGIGGRVWVRLADDGPEVEYVPAMLAATPSPAEQPKPAVRAEKLYDAIKEVLLHHRLSYTEGEDAEAFPLVDMLCPPGSRDISKGRDEITLICDAIYNDEAVRAAISGEQP